jgi:excisionase family DNA binding protein
MNPTTPLPELLTISAVAKLLGLHHRTIRRWLRQGTFIQPLRLHKSLRFRAQDVTAWLNTKLST